jgi:hypothetical protein
VTNYSFHPDAGQELQDAVSYYNECQDDLGTAFAKEVYSSIQNILQYPEAWPSISPNTRRCLVHRFPYGVIYQITDQEIYIIAIMQLNRKPKYWEDRIN